MKKYLFALLGLVYISVANATGLYGVANVNVTSDTANAAKNMAMTEARRQIITDVLGQYSDRGTLLPALQATDDAKLMGLIATTAIDGEQTSDTTYSANISMTLDLDAARQWLVENEIQNWLPNAADKNYFVVTVNLKDVIADWAELNKIARDEKIDFQTRGINGATVTLDVPVTQRGAFTIAVREGGWHFANMDTGLRIWK
ncbi:MAG: hypothetical protein IKA08_02350 [Alphaproteobacteria bacterium]|nr:hypothetical protein [Alphaproteobacteria bacterium]